LVIKKGIHNNGLFRNVLPTDDNRPVAYDATRHQQQHHQNVAPVNLQVTEPATPKLSPQVSSSTSS
jgi:hypothetical protein